MNHYSAILDALKSTERGAAAEAAPQVFFQQRGIRPSWEWRGLIPASDFELSCLQTIVPHQCGLETIPVAGLIHPRTRFPLIVYVGLV